MSAPPDRTSRGWDVYWDAARPSAVAGGKGELFAAFWRRVFAEPAMASRARVLEMACGAGVVSRQLTGTLRWTETDRPSIFCLDLSLAALKAARKDMPLVRAVAADARKAPFADQPFDLVVSQFGLEYADLPAFAEAARLTARGGAVCALIHYRKGAIYRECEASLETARTILESAFLPRAKAAFAAGFGADAGTHSQDVFRQADKKFTRAAKALHRAITLKGAAATDSLAARLYRDVAHMYERRRAYRAQDVYAWMDAMQHELEAYRGRMSAMLAAAFDERKIRNATEMMTNAGLTAPPPERLRGDADTHPAAWILRGNRPS